MGLNSGSPGYKAEKLAAVSEGFDQVKKRQASGVLLHDIEKLRKALARAVKGRIESGSSVTE